MTEPLTLTNDQAVLRFANEKLTAAGKPTLASNERLPMLAYMADAVLHFRDPAPTPDPTPTPDPDPTPTPTPSSTKVGLMAQRSSAQNDAKGAVNYVRIDTDQIDTNGIKSYLAAGLKVCLLISGPYSSSGVSAINPTTWANNALAKWKACGCTKENTPWLEVLNEPYGNWFWGPNAYSAANISAYAKLIEITYDTFHNALGNEAPLIIGAGENPSWAGHWGSSWFKQIDPSKVDRVSVHPYGGTGDRASSAAGHRDIVADAHSYSGKPVCITEVGWPTAVGQSPTGDSLQWSEADQATNIVNFANWCKGTGYVDLVTFFCHFDFGTNAWYGVCHSNGSHKPSYAALASVAK